MEKLKEMNVILDSIYRTLSYNLSPSGKIKLESTTAARLFTEISEAKKVIAELEKIGNYTNASTIPVKKEEPHKEMVSHPDHYQGNKIECIDAMLDVFGKEKVSAFCELNAFKYIWRSDSKGTDVQDKRKAIWYLDKYNDLKEKARCFFYPKNGHHYEVLSSVRAKNPSNGEWFDATLYTDGKGNYVREAEDFNNKFVDES